MGEKTHIPSRTVLTALPKAVPNSKHHIFIHIAHEPCQILLCKKRSYKFAFADPFAMLSPPHVLLSRALVSLELLSQRFRGGASHSMQAFAAGPSLVTFAISFRKLSRPAFWLSRGFYRTPPFTTLYCQGFWRCSHEYELLIGHPLWASLRSEFMSAHHFEEIPYYNPLSYQVCR